MKVKNITFKEYVELQDRSNYDYYIKYGKFKANDFLNIGEFLEKTFGFVKDMQYYASEGLQWDDFLNSVSELTGKDLIYLGNLSVFDLNCTRLYCIEQVKKINKIESDFLGHAATPEQEQADISRFGSYGSFIQFDKLAGGNILKFEEIKKLKYDFCFTKLKLEADKDSFAEDYHNVMRNKNK